MKIIILGAGEVGANLAQNLSLEASDITVVDTDTSRLRELQDRFDIRTITGKASHPDVMRQAGAEDADMIIAVTQNDETNMVICQVAYSIFKINKKIARIRGQEFLGEKWGKLYGESNLPIDVIISPEIEVAKSLQRKLDAPGALKTFIWQFLVCLAKDQN